MLHQNEYKGLEGTRILIVDDVEMNQYLARQILESWGCIVEVAENGLQAVETVSAADFVLVLMDIQMPVMDGIESTLRIRALADRERASTPIVALTANASKENCEAYIKAGMNDCLRKPFTETSLFQIVLKNSNKRQKENMNTASMQTNNNPLFVPSQKKRYDLSIMESISTGDQSFVLKMLQLFLETVPPSLQKIQLAVDSGQWPELSKLAHKLKATIDSMGIVELKEDIRTIELKAKTSESPDLLSALSGKVVLTMNEVMTEVKKDYSL